MEIAAQDKDGVLQTGQVRGQPLAHLNALRLNAAHLLHDVTLVLDEFDGIQRDDDALFPADLVKACDEFFDQGMTQLFKGK